MRGFTEILLREAKPLAIMAILFGFVLWLTGSKTLASSVLVAATCTAILYDELRRIRHTLEAIAEKLQRSD